MSVHEFYRLKALITLEQVNITESAKKKGRILISKTAISGVVNFYWMQMALVMRMRFIFGDDWNDVPCKSIFDLWQWCDFSRIEALEFSCIYTRVYPLTADVFPVVANTRTMQHDRGKRKRRKLERRWRKSRPVVDRELYKEQCKVVSSLIKKEKQNYYSNIIQENKGNQKVLFNTVTWLLHRNTEKCYPTAPSSEVLANRFADFFCQKIEV